MTLKRTARFISAILFASTLGACATADLTSDLYRPNYGMRPLDSGEYVDSRQLMNGLYAPKLFGVSPYAIAPYAPACVSAEFRCTQQAQSAWSSFDP